MILSHNTFRLISVLFDSLCGLVVRVPGCRTECILFPVRYELNLYMLCRRENDMEIAHTDDQSQGLQNIH
jgi:hypothetical protein